MKQKKRIWLPVILGTVTMLLVAAAGFFASRMQVELTLNGEQSMVLEYGQHYEEPGATAALRGLLREKLTPTTSGGVDEQTLGTYEITYEAGFLWLHRTRTRTVTVTDTEPPVITLRENPDSFTLPTQAYVEEGFTAQDNYDGDLTDAVTRTEADGTVIYTVRDSSGNEAHATRKINYADTLAPELTLLGEAHSYINAGSAFRDPGCTALDNSDGDLSDAVVCTGTVDIYRAGEYTLRYEVSDSYGNKSSVTRTVTVRPIKQQTGTSPSGKIIYLTFDDGPSAYTQQLLDVLAKYDIKASFFVVNYGHADMIAAEAAAGHTIGVHSATHEYSDIYASEDAYFADFYKMQDIINEQTGLRPTLLRFPGGSSNKVSCFNPGIMTLLTQAVVDMGMQYFDWNVSSGDAGETTDTEEVFQNVIDGVQKHDVSVVLQHDSKSYSVAAVEKIIVWGLANGYTFLPLDASSYAAHHHLNN